MASDPLNAVRATNARLLRRLTMSPSNELVERYDDATPTELVADVVDQPHRSVNIPTLDDDDDFHLPMSWWVDRMLDDDAAFHERMVWYWHGHLTSSLDKASGQFMLDQHALLRDNAFGNFRELLRAITLDPAMLYWLDGSGSSADAPNENYAREMLELFTLGRDSRAYTESDVRAGARALAGYWVNGDAGGTVEFDPDAALNRPVTFLGELVRNVDDVVDAACDQPACASFVAGRMYEHFVGGTPTPDQLDDLATAFRDNDLDIAPLARAIVSSQSFLDAAGTRPRSSLEWFLGLSRLVDDQLDIWPLMELGHAPMSPPNVAGWPGDERWLSSGMVLSRAQLALNWSWDTPTLESDDPVTDVLRRAVLYEVSDATRNALEHIVDSIDGRREQSTLLHAAVAMCPEFALT